AGVAWVPTLVAHEALLKMHRALGASEEGLAPLREAVNRLPDLVREAAGAGVTVLAGTDAGMAPHGLIREEIRRPRRARAHHARRPDRVAGPAGRRAHPPGSPHVGGAGAPPLSVACSSLGR